MTAAPPARSYSAALDGLRALAVSAVVVYHFAPRLLPAGFLGVDVFFVVSGFLITRILVGEIAGSGGIGLRAFWARRIRRLLPALAALTVVTIGVAAIVLTALERRGLPAQTVGTLTFSVNWVLIAQSGDYFATIGRPSPLLHLWSLAIEEQFYVVLPLVLVGLRSTVRRRPAAVAAFAFAGAVGSAVAMAVVAGEGAGFSRAYLGTATHASGLLVGTALGLLASSGARPPGRRLPAGGVIAGGALAVIGAVFLFADDRSLWLYRGGFLAFALVTALVVAVVVDRPDCRPARFLAAPPLVALGLRSYALYLWHWPVRVFLTPSIGLDGAALFALRLAVSLALAEVSYRLVERPFRSGAVARRTGTRGALLAYGAGGVAAVVLALTVSAPSAPPPSRLGDPGVVAPGVRRIDLFGDSTALVFGLAGQFGSKELGISVSGAAEIGCGVVLRDHVSAGRVIPNPTDKCGRILDRWRAALRDRPEAELALITGAWDILDHRVDGRTVRFGAPEWEALVYDSLRDALRILTADGRSVSLFQVPCFGPGDAAYPLPERADRARLAALDRIWARAAREVPGVRVVRWRDLVCPGGRRAERVDGVAMWKPDGVHLTPEGSMVVWRWWLPQLDRE